jgi:hypothetical protein
MQTFLCPRCSGEAEFADGASDDAVARCGICGVRVSLGEHKRIEWSNDFDARVKAVDWSAYENGEDKHDIDFRYAFAFRLGLLASRADEALPFVERALFRDGQPLAIADAAKPFLQELVDRFGAATVPSAVRLLEQIK